MDFQRILLYLAIISIAKLISSVVSIPLIREKYHQSSLYIPIPPNLQTQLRGIILFDEDSSLNKNI